VENLSKAMKTGAVMEIELDPYMSIGSWNIDEIVRSNPFHGLFDLFDALNTPLFLYFEQIGQEIPPEQVEMISKELVEKVRKELLFFHEQLGLGASCEQLVERLKWEAGIIHDFTKQSHETKVLVENHMLRDRTEDFKHFDQTQNLFGPFKNVKENQRVTVMGPHGKPVSGFVYDCGSFMTGTYLNFILSVIAVERNTPEIV
jgi:hypothetical protein